MTIIYFIISLGILVLIHELGHFIVARRNNIRVESFSIGFGPKILGFKRGETEYKIAPIPLGGYVKMTGEEPEESTTLDTHSFANKSVWTRIKVVIAGPLTHILLALVLLPIVFMIGRMEPAYLSEAPVLIGVKSDSPASVAGLSVGDLIKEVDGKSVSKWEDVLNKVLISAGQGVKVSYVRSGRLEETIVSVTSLPELKGGYSGFEPFFFIGNDAVMGPVSQNSPAAQAGIKEGDRVVAIDGETVEGWIGMLMKVGGSSGRPLTFTIDRSSVMQDIVVTPIYNEDYKRYVIGVRQDTKSGDTPMVKRKFGPIGAIKRGVSEFVTISSLTMEVLKRLFTFKLSYKALGGPIQIAQASVAAARYGLSEFINFIAFLSIQLGILNLLPIPVLDGGQIVFCAIESLLKRPVPIKVRAAAQYVGLAFILSMFILITINDIDSVWGIKKILGRFF